VTNHDLSAESDLAVAALASAGEVIRQARDGGGTVVDSTGRDLKLSTDGEAEARVLETLGRHSTHPVLAEESARGGVERRGFQWIVDPLDGSVNFHRGIPLYCVAVALLHDAEPVLGAILDLEREAVYSGIPGVGAWVGDLDAPRRAPIHVREVDSPGAAILATGLPVSRDFDAGALADFIPWFQQFKKVRMFGSAGISLIFLASGRVDAYAEDAIKIWDVAAGIALVRAAGGHVSMSRGTTVDHTVRVRAAGSVGFWGRVRPVPIPSRGEGA
jgi:myo-inositol-1(or 4)-monophosphatase